MLAIVIPYYKPEFFKDTLQSLDDQTNSNFSLYIGDDASLQDPLPILNNYKSLSGFTYKRFEKNLGSFSLTKQWERCLDMIKGEEWVMVLGDDDFLSPNVVESFYRHLPLFKNRSNVVRFSSRIITDNGAKISPIYQHPEWEDPGVSFMRRYRLETRSSLSEYIFLRKAYQKYGFYNYNLGWHSDDRAWLEFSQSKPIYSINDAVVSFRHSELNITGRIDNINQKDTATKQFYRYLAGNRLYFKKGEKLMFARIYERALRNEGTVSLKDWHDLTKIYLQNYQPNAFKKLLKRLVKEKILNKKVTV